VDQDAQPADWDDALATFLLACVERKRLPPAAASPANDVIRAETDQGQKTETGCCQTTGLSIE
jgi:hypothetical protein